MRDGLEQEYVQRAWSLIATSRESAFRIPKIYKVLSETRLVFYRLLNIFPTAKVVLLPPLTPLSETAWNERFRTFPRVYFRPCNRHSAFNPNTDRDRHSRKNVDEKGAVTSKS